MDLNHLFARHQMSLVNAEQAATAEARHAHAGLMHGYAARIATLQSDSGATSPMRIDAA
ncbi:hypothetical protein [Sphingomonas radiodurans]|uniref:hypothetical protein n=1 Tax=Sphingomonas radiodurans TaxID=2890321 RepID=UPI001E43A6F0|nr:hypothetical protein [Sphingomonas radiodurans]WBH17885.1 hypothetical protein LLW23_07245 [Sphingomonas radiodurans]